MSVSPVPVFADSTIVPAILVVDDEPYLLSEIASFLRRFGYSVHEANSPLPAQELLLRDESIGIVLTDLRMGEMSGVQLVEWIFQTFASSRPMEVIVMTGHGSQDAVSAALLGQLKYFLQKPFRFAELQEAVATSFRSVSDRWARRLNGGVLASRIADLEQRIAALPQPLFVAPARQHASLSTMDGATRPAIEGAIVNGALSLSYQALRDARDGSLFAIHASARWTDPLVDELTLPEFMRLIRVSNLQAVFNRWLIDTVLRDLSVAPSLSWLIPRLVIAVLPEPTERRGLTSHVRDLSRRARMSIENLIIAIPEEDSIGAAMLDELHNLRRMGAQVALSGFGRHEASWSRLPHLPADLLTISCQRFSIKNQDKNVEYILNEVSSIAHGNRMQLVADQVETQEQMQVCLRAGMDLLQGQLIGPVYDASGLAELIHREMNVWETATNG